MTVSVSKLAINPPPTNLQDVTNYIWKSWFNSLYARLSAKVFGLPGLSKANLPLAADWASNDPSTSFSAIVYVYDEAGGATLAFSDGTNWRRVQDRAIVS